MPSVEVTGIELFYVEQGAGHPSAHLHLVRPPQPEGG